MKKKQDLLKPIFGNIITKILLFSGFMLFSLSAFATNQNKTKVNFVKTDCLPPVFTLRSIDVTQANTNDAQLILSNLQNAKRYAFSDKGTAEMTYTQATTIDPTKKEIILKNLPNPENLTAYTVRVYNSETCFADHIITLEHVNFADLVDNSQLELIQTVDNHNPKINETVTFTTIISNKGGKTATDVEIQTLISSSLKVVYFYTDKGAFEPTGGFWTIGNVNGGETIKLVVKAKVLQQGLSYLTSYIWKQNGRERNIKARTTTDGGNDYGVGCVSVPISLKKGDNYKVTLQKYNGVKWYYKSTSSGVYEEITKSTAADIATINKDSSLSILKGGEYTFSKLVGTCNVSNCCSIIVEGCSGPQIVVDSIYCNRKVDSYSIKVKLIGDDWSIVQQVYLATSNIGFPTTTDYLKRLNRLPLQSSAGYVVANGNGFYTIENIPAFMPNVTLVATEISGTCSSSKIINAPNCAIQGVQAALVLNQSENFTSANEIPTFSLVSAVLPGDDFSKVTITALYPNPADDHLTLDYNLPETLPTANLVFYNISGTVIASYGLENSDTKIKITTETWREGMYFFQLSVNGRKMKSDKFIVVHN
jgi:uncharacterized repeat protein (TIGR01451 family)